MFVVYVYPNDGSATVELARKSRKRAAIRTIVERDNATDVRLMAFPHGKIVIRHVFTDAGKLKSHVVRSWDVSNLVPLQDPRDSATGAGAVKAFGVDSKGRVSGRVFRNRTVSGRLNADDVGALATLRKHPTCEDRYPATRSHPFAAQKPREGEEVYMASNA